MTLIIYLHELNYSFYISAVTDIDTSGIHAFEELLKTLKKRGIQVSQTIFSFNVLKYEPLIIIIFQIWGA